MGKVVGKVRESGNVLNALLIIGFLGIIWLIIYGNLSGNLGFTQDSTSFINETINLTSAGNTPTTAQGRTNGALSSIVITNATGGEVALVGNYSVSGVIISATALSNYTDTNVNISATVKYDTQDQINSDAVIGNLTGGVTTFFGFSNIWFTITAIALLIVILLGILFLVMQIMESRKGRSGFSG